MKKLLFIVGIYAATLLLNLPKELTAPAESVPVSFGFLAALAAAVLPKIVGGIAGKLFGDDKQQQQSGGGMDAVAAAAQPRENDYLQNLSALIGQAGSASGLDPRLLGLLQGGMSIYDLLNQPKQQPDREMSTSAMQSALNTPVGR